MADAAAEMEEGGMVRTLKDLFAGAAGGIAQVLLGEFIFLHARSRPLPNRSSSNRVYIWHHVGSIVGEDLYQLALL